MNKVVVGVLVLLLFAGGMVLWQRRDIPAPAPEPEVLDNRPMTQVLRERARWPVEVTLTKDQLLKVNEGAVTLVAGRKVRATMLNDAGLLHVSVAEQQIQVPFDETDFVDVVLAQASAPTPVVPDTPIVRPRSLDVDRKLAQLKTRFPVARKQRVDVGIRNADGSRRRDVIEVEVPHPDVIQRYRGWVMSASVASLPAIVAKLEAQLAADLAATQGLSLSNSANAQMYYSRQWLQSTMRAYIAELRALTR